MILNSPLLKDRWQKNFCLRREIRSEVTEIVETIHCRGHKNVRARHKSTFEITKDIELSESGDCIIGVGADKGAADLSHEFREALSIPGSTLTTVFSIGSETFEVSSEGISGITLTHPTDLVWRRSAFVCPRTIAVYSNAVAKTFPRSLVEKLQEEKEMLVTLKVKLP